MQGHAVEMCIEPGAETLLRQMGRQLGTRARSKTINAILSHLRLSVPIHEVAAWFSEDRVKPSRRTTIRLSPENAGYAKALSAHLGRGRPVLLLDIVYFGAARMSRADFEAQK